MKTIIAVAECGSIGRAAIRLGQSQPAVSGNVRRIEKHFGGELFHRSANGVRPTPLGDWVLLKARTLAAGLDQLTSTARRVACGDQDQPTLRIAGQPCPAMIALAPSLLRLLPGVDVEVRVDHATGWLLDQLSTGLLDLCLLVEPVGLDRTVPDGLHRRVVVAHEPYFAGISAAHPLAGKAIIRLDDLAGEDWVDNPRADGEWSAMVRSACRSAGFQPHVRYWIADPVVYSPIIRAGQAVGLFAGTSSTRDGVAFCPIAGDPVAGRIVLYWRDSARGSAEQVWTAATKAYQRVAATSPHLVRWRSDRR